MAIGLPSAAGLEPSSSRGPSIKWTIDYLLLFSLFIIITLWSHFSLMCFFSRPINVQTLVLSSPPSSLHPFRVHVNVPDLHPSLASASHPTALALPLHLQRKFPTPHHWLGLLPPARNTVQRIAWCFFFLPLLCRFLGEVSSRKSPQYGSNIPTSIYIFNKKSFYMSSTNTFQLPAVSALSGIERTCVQSGCFSRPRPTDILA